MNRRPFGIDGIGVSEVGLGCWQLGGDFGPMSEATANEILCTAVEQGISFFDTADVYGAGRSEALIGRFFRESDTDVFVATKFGREGYVYPDGYTEKTLHDCVDESLKRLGTERLDLLQLHCVPPALLNDGEIFDWLRRLGDEGKIARFGASVETVDEGLLCLEQEGISSLQVIFNVFRQKPAHELLPAAKAKGVSIIVRLPLASGLLAGKYTKQTTFTKGDHRSYNRDGQAFNVGETFAGLPFETGVKLADEIKPLVPDGMTMAQMALRWILDHDAVTVIIPGASSPEQAADNATVSRLPRLSDALHRTLAELYTDKVCEHIRGPY
jgi:aryl-alcohol dehydrogenase-like predicted oxidoreductase